MSLVTDWLAHPLTRGLDLDAPQTTALRRTIIQTKPFLRQVYMEWYACLARMLDGQRGPVLEIGAGGGFFKQTLPRVIASEVFQVEQLDMVADAHALPFRDQSLSGIAMLDVLHHLRHPGAFLHEATRCLRPGGVIAMVEPWVSPWARFVWSRLHHEPFDPERTDWRLTASGPLSSANSAIPWMIFERDRQLFQDSHPSLRVKQIRSFMPLAYLASGGVSTCLSLPGWSYAILRAAERIVEDRTSALNCFAAITVERV